ncbi:MAG: glycosyl transferase family protein [Parcubacteria group bacterium Gr01-1014_30]|nr:MAG: glycosyl transferase family protein [Parcubacteria group bacterium Gr01-1014_30]
MEKTSSESEPAPDKSPLRKRVAMFCHDDPLAQLGAQESGGQAVYVNSLLRELDKNGWSIDAFARLDSRHKKSVSLIGRNSRLIRLQGGPIKYISRKLLFDFLPELYENFLKFINRQNSYSLFHGHYWDGGWLAAKASKQFSVPFLQNFHSLGKIRLQVKEQYSYKNNGKDIFDKRLSLEEEISKHADAIISLSSSEKLFLQQQYKTFEEKIEVIPGGVNLKIFSPVSRQEARKKLALPEKELIILFVGRLEWRKGIGTLIHAANLLKSEVAHLKVLIIGGKIYGRQKNTDDFKEYQRLLKIVGDLGMENTINFLGCVDNNRLHLFYCSANALVVPSYYEPFGLVTLESMACKTTIIASNVGGLAKIIQDNVNGLLFQPRNPVDLKEKVLKIHKSPELAKTLTENGYKNVVENYSWKKIAEQISNIYSQLIGGKV